jgi:hypothetical protein
MAHLRTFRGWLSFFRSFTITEQHPDDSPSQLIFARLQSILDLSESIRTYAEDREFSSGVRTAILAGSATPVGRRSASFRPSRSVSMRLALDKAVLCLSLLTEGSSIRFTERISGVHRDTTCRLLRKAGAKCETLMNRFVRRVPVEDVLADELWCFVGCKEKTKKRKKITYPELGDAYTFVGLERGSKLALAFHLGRRTAEDARVFTAKFAAATSGDF